MRKTFLRIAALTGLLAVALGAFASHALKNIITPEHIATFEIGVRYQFYHTLALLFVSLLLHLKKARYLVVAGWLFCFGMLLFSGSLYLLAFQDVAFEFPKTFIGPLTPLGGVLFIAGWFFLFLSTYQRSESGTAS